MIRFIPLPGVALLFSGYLPVMAVSAQGQSPNLENSPSRNRLSVDFSWRQHQGDFPKDKPGYLILTTEDALRWSKMLPLFVRQKKAMGFHAYLATEKDYGTGKTGLTQAMQVREWLRQMRERTGAKYALLIGNSQIGSADLPAPKVPEPEPYGSDAPYCDLDGKWVDIYFNMDGSKKTEGLRKQAFQAGGPRQDELIVSRISYVGDEIGNGAYDLDKILEKTIRYEHETLDGKALDWRARGLSTITNYGGADWDDGFIRAAEAAGGTFEWRSERGFKGPYVPENIFDDKPANSQMLHRTRRAGMVCVMSHGWNRGGEGTYDFPKFMTNMDDRWPASVGVTACIAFCLADGCNQGQMWLRKGGIFACSTSGSGNNSFRVPLQTTQLEQRCSVGEAVHNEVVQYGDPSLHVLPPEGTPVCALRVQPAFAAHYEERTLEKERPLAPMVETYTLTNQTRVPMEVAVQCDAAWVSLSKSRLWLKPGETARVTANSTARMGKMAPGVHIAKVRFLRADGQRDERRFAVNLQPVSLIAAYSFDATVDNNRFPDQSLETQPKPGRDESSLWLEVAKVGRHKFHKTLGARIEGFAPEPAGKVGGALRLDRPKEAFSRSFDHLWGWCGVSASLWFRVDALPQGKQTSVILAAPFSLSADAAGALSFALGGKPAPLGKVEPGEWHFVQLRTDVASGKVRASLDGGTEIACDAKPPLSGPLTLGTGTCTVDEIKVWAGELSGPMQAAQFAARDKVFARPTPATPPSAAYAGDGVLRAPEEVPSLFELTNAKARLDLTQPLAGSGLVAAGLREAPEWLELKNGVLGLKPGVDFDRIDFGGYDCFVFLKAANGRFCEHPLKVRIPVPSVNIRFARAADNTLSIVNAGDGFFNKADTPLAKGVIRYTTDGSPVTEMSPIYEKPFKGDGAKVTARFFYLGEYPYAPVTIETEFGILRNRWKPLACSGKFKPAALAQAFDSKAETAWRGAEGELPQFYAWDMGTPTTLTSLSVQSSMREVDGRIKDFVLHASDDGEIWRKVKEGAFESTPGAVKILFDSPLTARCFKLEATNLHGGENMVVSEIEAFTK